MSRCPQMIIALLVVASTSTASYAHAQDHRGTLVMAVGREPTHPIPYIGPPLTENADIADQMFMRLAGLSPGTRTTGDDAMVPELASSWRRINATTVEFTIDSRARWHDGTPVTSRDVTFAWQLIKAPELGVDLAPFALIESVEIRDQRRVRFHYSRPSAEQVYVAGFLVQPMPAHLLESIPPAELATSDYVNHPIGNGPYRYSRRVPGQFIELRADANFFLGRPGLSHLVVRIVPSPDARLNLLLSGETDVMPNLLPSQRNRVEQRSDMRVINSPNNLIMYLLFNSKTPGDPTVTHPILDDVRVRQALALAIDRRAAATTGYGPSTQTPRAVRSQAWYWLGGAPDAGAANTATAKSLLDEAGWRDLDGDGVRERNDTTLTLKIIYPSQSAVRGVIATQVEQWWSGIGVDVDLAPITGPIWAEQRRGGNFDVDITAVNQDPSPSSLTQSWSCAAAAQPGSSNVAHWCDPRFDNLLKMADNSADPVRAFRRALLRMAEWQPAVTVAAPINAVAVHSRYENVIIRPAKTWTHLWQWRIKPGAALPRDR
jgi:peptide/nickel transport system substrate-binding protein